MLILSVPTTENLVQLGKLRGHFAKSCVLSKRRLNLVQENEEASGTSIDCNFIDAEYVSEPEYGVLQLEKAVRINSIEILKSNGGTPKRLSIQLHSGHSLF